MKQVCTVMHGQRNFKKVFNPIFKKKNSSSRNKIFHDSNKGRVSGHIFFFTFPDFSPGSLWPVINYKQRPESDELPDGPKSCHDHEQCPSQVGRCCELGGGSQQASGCGERAEDGPAFCSHRVPHSNRGGEWLSDISLVTVTVTFIV